jgi:hypothetical protein
MFEGWAMNSQPTANRESTRGDKLQELMRYFAQHLSEDPNDQYPSQFDEEVYKALVQLQRKYEDTVELLQRDGRQRRQAKLVYPYPYRQSVCYPSVPPIHMIASPTLFILNNSTEPGEPEHWFPLAKGQEHYYQYLSYNHPETTRKIREAGYNFDPAD